MNILLPLLIKITGI